MSGQCRYHPKAAVLLAFLVALLTNSCLPFPRNQQAAAEPAKSPGVPDSFGTGFFVSSKGHFLTSHHVVDGALRIWVVDTQKNEREATILAADRLRDLALCRVELESAGLPLDPGVMEFAPGGEVFSIGFSDDESFEETPKTGFGRILGSEIRERDVRFYRTSAPIRIGNSGGPLISARGEVIGVVKGGRWVRRRFWEIWRTWNLFDVVNYAVQSVHAYPIVESQVPAPDLPAGPLAPPGLSLAELARLAGPSVVKVFVDLN